MIGTVPDAWMMMKDAENPFLSIMMICLTFV